MHKTSQKTSLALALIGATGGFLAMPTLAQTVVETPGGNTAVIVDPALQPQPPVGAVAVPAFPLPEQIQNDQVVIETLLSQGFTDIHILREGALMTVNAQRNGQPTELVYSIANGSLVSVDGVEMRAGPDTSSGGDVARDVLGGNSSGGTTDADDGAEDGDMGADVGTGAGGDTGTGTGGEAGAGGSDSGADGGAGSDGASGSGGGSDSGSDGGSASGSDGGSDSGSDGGSDGGSGGSGSNG